MKLLNLLEATRPAYWYHGTPLFTLASIIHQDRLDEGGFWGRPHEKRGPRFSRDIEVAKIFTDNDEWPVGGILVVSPDKIKQNYKTQPYADTDSQGNFWSRQEAEEVVITPEIKPLSRYLEYIICPEPNIKRAMAYEWLEDAVETYDTFTSPDQAHSILLQLLSHPKRVDKL